MPVEVSVKGAEELAVITRRLKEMGDKDLRKELLSGLNRTTKPLRAEMKKAAAENLPQRGGLAQRIAGSKFGASNRGGGRNPGVRVTVKLAGHDLKAIDKGRIRHPVFGNRSVWVLQDITPNVFTDAFEEQVGEIRDELMDVLENVARKVVDGR